ncbi:MAG: hypothetical protein RLZZ324_1152 [Candidatus Parcubacteria bacterium]|jgi:hypothetical protein
MQVELVPSHSLFTTPDFTASPWIAKLCAAVPFVWVTSKKLTSGHFGTYFGASELRKYANPYIQDLYWLHELTHIRTYAYIARHDYLPWTEAMFLSEMESSLTSECFAYLNIPGLRDKTFQHPIWADRFMTPAVRQDASRFHNGIRDLSDKMRAARRRVINDPDPADFLEQQIANYGRQNWAWYRIWRKPAGIASDLRKPAYLVVEDHMSMSDRDERHQDWLESVSLRTTQLGDVMPFARQAAEFKAIYEKSGEEFGNHLLAPYAYDSELPSANR